MPKDLDVDQFTERKLFELRTKLQLLYEKGEKSSIIELQRMIDELEASKRTDSIQTLTDDEFENYQFKKVRGFQTINKLALERYRQLLRLEQNKEI